jgi:hypothetical protein
MDKVIVHEEFFRQGEHKYLQQLKSFAYWFWDLFSTLLNKQTSRKQTHIPAGMDFWTCVDWDFIAQLSEYYTLLMSVTLFLMPCIYIM